MSSIKIGQGFQDLCKQVCNIDSYIYSIVFVYNLNSIYNNNKKKKEWLSVIADYYIVE